MWDVSLPNGLKGPERPEDLVVRQEGDVPGEGVRRNDSIMQLRPADAAELGPSLLRKVRPDEILAPAEFVEKSVAPPRGDQPYPAALGQPQELSEDDLGKEQRPPPVLRSADDGESPGRELAFEQADQGDGVQDSVRQGLVSRRNLLIDRSRSRDSIRPLRRPCRLWRGRGRMSIPTSVSTTMASSPSLR